MRSLITLLATWLGGSWAFMLSLGIAHAELLPMLIPAGFHVCLAIVGVYMLIYAGIGILAALVED